MLQKLFRSKPTAKNEEDKYAQSLLGTDPWSPPSFDANQIRVIVCQDTGDKTKLTLFDSAISTPNTSNDRDHANIESSSWSGVSFLAGNFLPKSSSAINIKSSTSTHPRIQDSIHNNENKRRSFDSVNQSNANTLPPSNRSPRKTAHNIDIIGDMMFGTVPLSYKGMTTKIHLMRSPKPQILLTKLFSINPSDLESNSSGRRGSFSSTSSDTSMSSSTQGSVITTNGPRNTSKTTSDSSLIFFDDFSELSDDESFRATSSLPSLFHAGPPILGLRTSGASITSTSSLSTSPRNTFTNRRLRRFSHTSMENGIFNPTPLPGSTVRSDQLTGNLSLKHPSRSFVYSVGVVLSLEDNDLLESFVFSHFALLENRLHQLYSNVFKLICHLLRKSPASSSISGPNSIFNSPCRPRISASSLSSLMLQNEPFWLDVVTRFKTSVCQLYNAPRIQEPLWLTMSTFPHKREKLAKRFMSELSYLLEKYDDKRSNFFISTLITSILMYHLSWVPTVACVADFEERNGKDLFYDPLWAQLGDLYGTIGTPSIMSRTIIVGTDENTVRRILFILSYFIRCNEIFERSEDVIPLGLQLEEECKTSLNCDKILSSESTLSDGNTPQNGEAETLNTQNINEKRNDNVSNDSANKGDVNNNNASDDNKSNDNKNNDNKNNDNKSNDNKSNDNKSNDNKSNDNKSNDDKSNDDANINHNKSHKRTESRHKRVIIDFPFTDISVESFLDVPMPKSQIQAIVPDPSPAATDNDKNSTNTKDQFKADELFVKSYGRSLMAGYCEKYMSDFVLMGLPNLDEFQDSLETDLKNSLRMQPFSSQDPVSKSVCILGQLNTLSCSILGCEAYNSPIIGGSPPVTVQEDHIRNVSGYFVPSNTKSDYVYTMLHQCKNLYTNIDMPAESCLEYLEDQLRILYHKAIMYKNYFAKSSPPTSISSQHLFVQPSKNEQVPTMLEALGLHEPDIQLVDAVSSTL